MLTQEFSEQWLEQHGTRGTSVVQVLAMCPESLPYSYEGFLSGNPYWSAVRGVNITVCAVSNDRDGQGVNNNQLSFAGRPGDFACLTLNVISDAPWARSAPKTCVLVKNPDAVHHTECPGQT